MNHFVQSIRVNKLLHLENFDIDIPAASPHLIITGKNGSGKTVLLKALADFLELVKNNKRLDFTKLKSHVIDAQQKLEASKDAEHQLQYKNSVAYWSKEYDKYYSKAYIEFVDLYKVAELIQQDDFILAFYPAERKPQMIEPNNPIKPNLPKDRKVKDLLTNQFLFFLADFSSGRETQRSDGKATIS